MDVKIQPCRIEFLKYPGDLFRIEGRGPLQAGIRIRRHHRCCLDLQGAVHEYLQRVNFHVRRVKLKVEALHTIQSFLQFPRFCEHIASVDIDRQLSLSVQLAQMLVDPLLDPVVFREAGVKYTAHAIFHGAVEPSRDCRGDLLIRQIVQAVE